MFMSDGDIITSFKQAKDQQKQIQVLADLNSCTKAQMVSKLLELGLVDAGKAPKKGRGAANKGRAKNEEADFRRQALYDEGATDAEMAEILGLSRSAIVSWRRKKGLPQHYKKNEQPAAAAPEQPEAAAEPIEETQPETAAPSEEVKPVEVAREVSLEEELQEAATWPEEPVPMTASALLAILQRVAQGWPDAPIRIRGEGVLGHAHLSIVFGADASDSDAELVLYPA